ncbi:unnamed protein product [Phytomonas sp. Hart1]|nr:unnamed protein product [Phytomonas sp. Hart1]|eukprot:CCW66021.1 unnamed protein product [Phytomonas sp. isolate Hart1]
MLSREGDIPPKLNTIGPLCDEMMRMPLLEPRGDDADLLDKDHPYASPTTSSSQAHYATLVNLNTSLQQRLVYMENELMTAFTALQPSPCPRSFGDIDSLKLADKETGPTGSDVKRSSPVPHYFSNTNLVSTDKNEKEKLDLSTPSMEDIVRSYYKEIRQLQQDLKQTQNVNKKLSEKWKSLKKEHKVVLEDNAILANGAEAIYKELTELKKQNRKQTKTRHTPSVVVDEHKRTKSKHLEKG